MTDVSFASSSKETLVARVRFNFGVDEDSVCALIKLPSMTFTLIYFD